mgnify:CR=1 FL=1
MSISELNHFMTYVIDGWLLFSAGFISIGFVSFVSRRIQEDIEADALALAQQMEQAIESATTQSVETTVSETAKAPVQQTTAEASAPPQPNPAPHSPTPPADPGFPSEDASDATDSDIPEEDAVEAASLEEVAAVSEKLAKNRGKQSDTSSVSVST